ncbi:MAG TPA: hypothetical protein VL527_03340, partial [Dongiaceae bacterium]|nr:hypothetical protein [Dongiaceae bacterium]
DGTLPVARPGAGCETCMNQGMTQKILLQTPRRRNLSRRGLSMVFLITKQTSLIKLMAISSQTN